MRQETKTATEEIMMATMKMTTSYAEPAVLLSGFAKPQYPRTLNFHMTAKSMMDSKSPKLG